MTRVQPRHHLLVILQEMAPAGGPPSAFRRWGTDCAARVLPAFERHSPADSRPRDALVQAWANADFDGQRKNAADGCIAACDDIRAKHAVFTNDSLPAWQAASAAGCAAMGDWRNAASYAAEAAMNSLDTRDPAAMKQAFEAEVAWQTVRLADLLTHAHRPEDIDVEDVPLPPRLYQAV